MAHGYCAYHHSQITMVTSAAAAPLTPTRLWPRNRRRRYSCRPRPSRRRRCRPSPALPPLRLQLQPRPWLSSPPSPLAARRSPVPPPLQSRPWLPLSPPPSSPTRSPSPLPLSWPPSTLPHPSHLLTPPPQLLLQSLLPQLWLLLVERETKELLYLLLPLTILPNARHFLKVEKIVDVICADLTFHVLQSSGPHHKYWRPRHRGGGSAQKTQWVWEPGAGEIPVSVCSWTCSASLCVSSHGRSTGDIERRPPELEGCPVLAVGSLFTFELLPNEVP